MQTNLFQSVRVRFRICCLNNELIFFLAFNIGVYKVFAFYVSFKQGELVLIVL